MNKAVVFGGSNGIGLAVSLELKKRGKSVMIFDRVPPPVEYTDLLSYTPIDLSNLKTLNAINPDEFDTLFYSAGIGRLAPFETFNEIEIERTYQVNTISLSKLLHKFYPKLKSKDKFMCGVMVSIAGHIASPLFALYGASKSAVKSLIENINIELEASNTTNRVLDISPGSISGTRFNGASSTDLSQLNEIAHNIVDSMEKQKALYIPQYDTVYKNVIERYKSNPHRFGLDSYEYKLHSGRITPDSKVRIGYLSGTFDLFHIGHLNLLRKAKSMCDYLVVGVHKDASHKGKSAFIPFEERKAIIESIKYVDRVIESEKEDCDVYLKNIVKYNYLFVGSDYKGSERFNRYEQLFEDKDVEIVYFPYTKGTSSTQLRNAITK